jgi:hypothetical protein
VSTITITYTLPLTTLSGTDLEESRKRQAFVHEVILLTLEGFSEEILGFISHVAVKAEAPPDDFMVTFVLEERLKSPYSDHEKWKEHAGAKLTAISAKNKSDAVYLLNFAIGTALKERAARFERYAHALQTLAQQTFTD